MVGAAAGIWKNLSRVCCVLEADGVQAGVSAGPEDAGLKLGLVCRADSWVARLCGVAGRGSGALGVTAGRGLTAAASCASRDHPVGELLVTCILALPPRGPTVSLCAAGLPKGTWERVVAGVSAAAGTKPLAVELPTTGSQAAGLRSGPASLCPHASWAFCGALRGFESVGSAAGCVGTRPGNLGLAEAGVEWWLELTKMPGLAVAS